MVKNHNPDYCILYPPFAGVYVELKGHIIDREFFPMLEQFPSWLKERYKVVLASRAKKEAEKYATRLDKIGIDHAYMEIKPEWIKQALELYEEFNEKNMGVTDPVQFVKKRRGKHVVGPDSLCIQTSLKLPQPASLSALTLKQTLSTNTTASTGSGV